jgi:hypothetical protein
MMISRRFAAIAASVAALLAAPATASAHGLYDWYDPDATAPDGHYVVSLTWSTPVVPEGFAAGDMLGWITCVWSDGSVDDCGELADYL